MLSGISIINTLRRFPVHKAQAGFTIRCDEYCRSFAVRIVCNIHTGYQVHFLGVQVVCSACIRCEWQVVVGIGVVVQGNDFFRPYCIESLCRVKIIIGRIYSCCAGCGGCPAFKHVVVTCRCFRYICSQYIVSSTFCVQCCDYRFCCAVVCPCTAVGIKDRAFVHGTRKNLFQVHIVSFVQTNKLCRRSFCFVNNVRFQRVRSKYRFDCCQFGWIQYVESRCRPFNAIIQIAIRQIDVDVVVPRQILLGVVEGNDAVCRIAQIKGSLILPCIQGVAQENVRMYGHGAVCIGSHGIAAQIYRVTVQVNPYKFYFVWVFRCIYFGVSKGNSRNFATYYSDFLACRCCSVVPSWELACCYQFSRSQRINGKGCTCLLSVHGNIILIGVPISNVLVTNGVFVGGCCHPICG